MNFKDQVKIIAPFLGILLIILITPPNIFNSIVYFYTPQTSVLGEDKTPPSSIKYIPNPATEVQNSSITLSGAAESESTVNIYLNGELVKTTSTGNTSNFSVDLTLKEAENKLYIIVIDRNGNVGESTGIHPIKWLGAS